MTFSDTVRAALDNKTKPVGSLGVIESLARQIAEVQQSLTPSAERCTLTIFAADHGMAAAGVSAFPSEVTRQMVLNFLSGGAAANVFARSTGANVQVVDAGVLGAPIEHPDLIQKRVAPGTRNAITEPAMSADQLEAALAAGDEIGRSLTCEVACFGEMGIGNTSSASLVSAKTLGLPIDALIGRGTGLDDAGLARKADLLAQAAQRTLTILDARTALQEYGGFEIAMMCGAMMAASETGRLVIIDGFIASAAALCALKLRPECAANFIYAHCSAESGHRRVLDAIQARPLLDLDLRLGEGTGALLAWPLVKAAAAMLREMASFESAGVSGPG
ncbi:MAG: nicotinate-nucleotide--dimethylbenzimidazole phosphoribosyltransferase [Hyphomonadaceae bacterium]|nr:nicotinate-nucleotide--dimethylbenzimidazole phosphoribosyltransferase [Hyphomonadaceae bacterium]